MPAALALPDIGLFLAACLLLLLAAGLFILRGLLVGAFRHIPFIGGAIAGTLGGWLDAARNDVIGAAHSCFSGAERVFHTIGHWLWILPGEILGAVAAAVVTIEHIATVQIPHIWTDARNWATHQALSVYHDAVTWYHDALHAISAAESAAHAELVHAEQALSGTFTRDIAAAEGYARSLVSGAERVAAAELAALDATVAAGMQALARTVTADVSAAELKADALFRAAESDAAAAAAAAQAAATAIAARALGGLVTDLEVLGNQAVDTVWRDAAGDIDALKQVLGDAFPDIQSLLKFLEGAGAAGLLGALIRALAGSAVATRALKDCVIPNCKNLSQFGRDISELGSAASAAAMLGWLAFIATDPVAAADDTVNVAAPLVDGVFSPLAALLSAGAEHL